MKKYIFLAVILLLFIPMTFAQANGNCTDGWDRKDESAPFTSGSTGIVTKVAIKSGQGCFVFLRNDTIADCYKVTGIGTNSAKAVRVGDPGPECQEISHVEFHIDKPPTQTPTATDGIVTRNTPTFAPSPTMETPFKFWTPTPQTPTPEITDTPTPTVTGTPPTPTITKPPKRKRTPTPQVFLPETGINGSLMEDDSALAWLFVLIMIRRVALTLLAGF